MTDPQIKLESQYKLIVDEQSLIIEDIKLRKKIVKN